MCADTCGPAQAQRDETSPARQLAAVTGWLICSFWAQVLAIVKRSEEALRDASAQVKVCR
eukprot:6182084-Pleurochrysis_carterae.AAC.1